MNNYPAIADMLTDALDLRQSPVAICFTETIPPGVKSHTGRVPAGCRFWQDGAAGPFATSEDAAEQRSGPGSHRGVNNAGSASPARLDRAFDVDFLAGRGIVKLDELSVEGCAASVRHYQPIEAQHHCRVALQSA